MITENISATIVKGWVDMKKRILAALVLAAMAMSLFSACGEKETVKPAPVPEGFGDATVTQQEQTMPTAPQDQQPKTTVTLGHTMDGTLLEAVHTQIEAFSARYPWIRVELQQLKGDVTEENRPHVLCGYPEDAEKYRDALSELDSWIQNSQTVEDTTETVGLSQGQLKDIHEMYLGEGKLADTTYMLPLCRQTLVLYYNRTFFEECELEVPFFWEEVEAVCEKIKQIDPQSVPLACSEEADWFITLCAQNGGFTVPEGVQYGFDHEQNRAFVKQLNGWYQKGYLTTGGLSGGKVTLAERESVPRNYMVIGSSADVGNMRPEMVDGAYAFELGILDLPQSEAGDGVLVHGPGLSLFNTGSQEEKLAAWLLVKYLTTNEETQAQLAMNSGYLPVLASVDVNGKYSAFLDAADGGEQIAALSELVCMEQRHRLFAGSEVAGNVREQAATLLNQCLRMTGEDLDGQIGSAFAQAQEACNNG